MRDNEDKLCVDAEIEAAWLTEIERRVDAYRRGDREMIEAEEVFARIERKLGLSSAN